MLSTHLVMPDGSSRESVSADKQEVHDIFRADGFMHITVDIELEGELCAAEE